jgi:hypothetical protein
MRLLLPEVSDHGSGNVLLPALASRTWAVRSATDEALLVVCTKSGDINVRAGVRGDDILLRIGVSGVDTEVPLDLPLIREAWSCRIGPGFTELSDAITPRLERARASLLRIRADGASQRYGIFDGGGFSEIVLANPGGRAR